MKKNYQINRKCQKWEKISGQNELNLYSRWYLNYVSSIQWKEKYQAQKYKLSGFHFEKYWASKTEIS